MCAFRIIPSARERGSWAVKEVRIAGSLNLLRQFVSNVSVGVFWMNGPAIESYRTSDLPVYRPFTEPN